MEGDGINPQYKVVLDCGFYGIKGEELSSGETVLVGRVSKNEEAAKEYADFLNRNKVSVHHAKDIIRDMLIEPLLQ